MKMASENLEFKKILEHISSYASNEDSMKFISSIAPLKSIDEINKRFQHVRESIELINKTDFHISKFPSISSHLKRIGPWGSVFDANDLRDIMMFLEACIDTIREILHSSKNFFNSSEERNSISRNLDTIKIIYKRLNNSIDTEANIRDDASPQLKRLRKKIKNIEIKIKNGLEEIMKRKEIAPLLQENFMTKRDSRWVLPVKIDFKRKIPGIIHDVSRSGDTAFIEPIEILPLSQKLEELQAEEKIEEMRILRDMTEEIRKNYEILEKLYRLMIYIDAIHSISRFALRFNLRIPEVNIGKKIVLKDARHPLLMINKGMEEVIPLSLELGENHTIMVITGPNTGGKTVALKTIGIISLMALSGLPVSASESTVIPYFNKIIVDLGDGQSVEEGISTFSYHIKNINFAINESDERDLILIDELGRGTSPEEGGALACATIEELRNKKAITFITTHLNEVKRFTMNMDGVLSASMEFDEENLQPTYRLKIGTPSPSYGIEMAKRLGLKERVTRRASNYIARSHREIDELLQGLKKKQKEYEILIEESRLKNSLLEKKLSEVEEKLTILDEEKKRILKKATEDALELVRKTKKEMNFIMEEFKRTKKLSTVSKEIKSTEDAINKNLSELSGESSSQEDVQIGDAVRIRSLGVNGTVLEIRNDRAKISVGGMEIEVQVTDTIKIDDMSGSSTKKEYDADIPLIDDNEEIILKGMRVDDAIRELERSLNYAFISEKRSLKIIHGKGSGVLMKAVREYLSSHPLVKTIRNSSFLEGGEGVTIAELK